MIIRFLCVSLVLLVGRTVAPGCAEDESGETKSVDGLAPVISLRYFLRSPIEKLENAVAKEAKPRDRAILTFLKELLKDARFVWLSASSVKTNGRLVIQELCDPEILGCTAFPFTVAGERMHGEFEASWRDVKILPTYKMNKDLAHGELEFKVKIRRPETRGEDITESINSKLRFVLFDHKIDPVRVYLFNHTAEIYSVPMVGQRKRRNKSEE
jgi:hypothetical protein